MLIEEGESCWGEPHDHRIQKSAIIGFLPNRELGAGGTPGVHYFFVTPELSPVQL
jgi:hypothetical protein